jgi:YbbR domain-containing protein
MKKKGGVRLRTVARQALFENFWLKLVSLLCALAAYGFIHSAQDVEMDVEVKIIREMPPDNVSRKLISDVPSKVDVQLVGPLSQLEAIRAEELSIKLNLQGAESQEVRLTADMINELPPRVRVERVRPSRLEIRFEDVVSAPVQVQVPRTGEPATGMEIRGSITVEPVEVTATGIESLVSTIQYARTQAFDVSNLGPGLYTQRLLLHEPPEGVIWDVDSVEATVEVVRRLETKPFLVEVEVVGVARASVKPPTVRVSVTGAPERLETLRKEAIIARVDPKAAGFDVTKPGSELVPVLVEIADAAVSVEPDKVLVKWLP